MDKFCIVGKHTSNCQKMQIKHVWTGENFKQGGITCKLHNGNSGRGEKAWKLLTKVNQSTLDSEKQISKGGIGWKCWKI
jgi:hypothetical protein